MKKELTIPSVVCIGAVLVDELYYCYEPVIAGTSNPATMTKYAGGVMRNIAHHLVLLGISTTFITVAGNDSNGAWLINDCLEAGIDMSAVAIANCSTGKYAALLNPDGSLYSAAAVNPCEPYFDSTLLQERIPLLLSANIIVADTNCSKEVLSWLIAFCKQHKRLLCIEPVSVSKAKKLAGLDLHGVYLLTPNEDELQSLNNSDTTEKAVGELLLRGAENIWLRKGAHGSVMYSNRATINLAAPVVKVKDSTGAGDAALAAWIAAHCLGMSQRECMMAGHAMAATIIQKEGAIDKTITQQTLLTATKKYYPHDQSSIEDTP